MDFKSQIYTLVASAATWNRLQQYLAGSRVERMAFGYCSAASCQGKTRLLLHEVVMPSDGEYSVQHSARVVLRAAETVPYLIRAKGAGAFLDGHSHPFPGAPHPSLADTRAAGPQFNCLQAPAPGALLVRIIVSADRCVWAVVHNGPDSIEPVKQIHLLGRTGFSVIQPVNSPSTAEAFQEMDRRTLACIGESRLSKMRGLTVGVIGVGGVGSMVTRLLGGLVGKLILVDPDRIEVHNVPRVWFARARSRELKVHAARRALHRAFPNLAVSTCTESFPSPAACALLAAADFLFVCPDHNAVRFSASRFASAKMLPLIEVGCGGRVDNREISSLGYHVRLQTPGGPCLVCNGLDLSRLEDPATTEFKRRLGYIEHGNETAGELAPLTTRAAADAVDVFQRYCTGYPGVPPTHLYNDSLHLKTVDLSDTYSIRQDCPACGTPDRWPISTAAPDEHFAESPGPGAKDAFQ